MRRIALHIMDYAAPYKGNFIPSIQNLGKHLEEEGGSLIFLFPEIARSLNWAKELQRDGKVYFIDNSMFSKQIKYSNIKYLKSIIKKENVNIIHTHFVAYNYTLALMKVLFLRRVKLVGNFMNEFLPPKNFYNRFKVLVTDITFDSIIASSAAVKQSVITAGITKKKITTIYNALDTNHLKSFEILNFKDNDAQHIILMFGWTFHRKGVDIAVKAIKELIDEKKNLRLVIATAGGQEIIKNEIISLLGNLPSWISLIGPNPNVASYYNSADIYLSSSREEGFTYSVLEASYCKPLIIVSEIGGHPLDVPFIGKFECENYAKLKSVILDMLTKTKEERIIIKEAQRKYVCRKYDINNWSKDIINLYSSL